MVSPSIVLIESSQPDNSAFGTGFVIHHSADATYLLTCAHVVRDVGGAGHIRAATLAAEVVALGAVSGLDLAVLRIQRLNERPPLRLAINDATELDVTIEGHYKHSAYRPLETISGRTIGSFRLADVQQTRYVTAWHIAIDDREKLMNGYSGSPVCDATGAVIGLMITSTGKDQGAAISIAALPLIWPELPAGLLSTTTTTHSTPMQKPAEATTASAEPSQIYLAAHPNLRGVADGRPDETVIDWARDFMGNDPTPDGWKWRFIPDLERHQQALRREGKQRIRLRAFARNSAGLAFGFVFNQRAGFQIHYLDNRRNELWRTDEPTVVGSPLSRTNTSLSQDGRDLILEVAVAQSAHSVTDPVDAWLRASGGPSARGQFDLPAWRDLLNSYFNESELQTLCFDLGVDYGNLPGQTRIDKAQSLVVHIDQLHRGDELLSISKRLRPAVAWERLRIAGATGPAASIRRRILLELERRPLDVTPAEGATIARQVCDLVMDEGRTGGTVHLFGALPLGVALLIGWGLRAGRLVQFYDLNGGQYQPTCLLRT